VLAAHARGAADLDRLAVGEEARAAELRAEVPLAPSTSNLASPRVLPPFAVASASSSSRAPWIALAIAARIAPRSAKVIARSCAPAARANVIAWPRSRPADDACASGSSVAGLTSTVGVPPPVCHRPAR
jgi:hypothetical protein